ncbi:E3 SUMO-protein ligase ZBED1-like [Tachysurus ichikawai]
MASGGDNEGCPELADAPASFISAKDMQPWSVIECEGFCQLMNVLEPQFNIPCRRHFSTTVILKLYDETRAEIEK